MNPKLAAALASLTIPAFIAGQLTAPEQDYVTKIVEEQAGKDRYVQVLEGNKSPEGSNEKLTTKLPDNVSINTHEGPQGVGYSIVTRYQDRSVSVGVGAYASDNTWVHVAPVISATSTRL